MPSKKRPTNFVIEELEPRILFSADPFGTSGFPSAVGVAAEKHLSLSNQDLSSLGLLNEPLQFENSSVDTGQPIKQRITQSLTTTILADKDTYITQNNKNANYGQAGQIQIDISSGADLGKERILLQFDLSSIPADATITNAELRMDSVNHSGSGNITVNVHTIDEDEVWDEGGSTGSNGTANWDDRQPDEEWDESGGSYNSTPVASSSVTGTSVHTWDLTSTAQNWLDGSTENRGVIIGSPQTGSDVFTYLSAEGSATQGPRLEVTYTVPNSPPTATLLSAGESYYEDTPSSMGDIVVSDVDNATTSVKLTLSDPSAASLTTGTSGSVTSTYDAGSGVWQASGAIADVNALLASVAFVPSLNYDSVYSIATSVTDGTAPAITGTKIVNVTPVNDSPTASNLSDAEVYTEDSSLNLTDIVVSDVDSNSTTATLTLSDVAAGALSTASSGAVTSTYNPSTGEWQASGAIADVNTLLAGVTFNPASNFDQNFSIATHVSDGVAPPLTGSKIFTATPVNDPPLMANNSISVMEGESLQLSSANISATDPDNTESTLVFSVSNVTGGQFESASDPDVPLSSFSQAELAAGNVYFVHNGDEAPPAYDITVGDGLASSPPASPVVNYVPVNDPPVITGISGSSTVVANDGLPVVIGAGAIAGIDDPELPSSYAGAALLISSTGFSAGDTLGLDTSGAISLSSGLDSGSQVSVGGALIGTVSVSSSSGFEITFNGSSNASHIDSLLNSITFASSSKIFSQRAITIEFDDGGGSANGGSSRSAATVYVHLRSEDTGLVAGYEDSAYIFSASDFAFTGVSGAGLQFIQVVTTPTEGQLTLSGNPVIDGQRIERADIDSGQLHYLPEQNANGQALASMLVQVNNGILSANVLAGQPNSYTVGGSRFSSTNAILASPDNFGSAGTFPTSISIVSTSANIDEAYLAQGDIFFDGDVSDSQWLDAELDALELWVDSGGILISTTDSTGSNRVSEYFGLSVGGASSSTWWVADENSAIIDGSFGRVGNNGASLSATGLEHIYFSSTSLAPGDQTLAVDSASGQPTIVMRPHGAGWIFFSGDEGVFRANTTGGGAVTTSNDLLIANLFAWAIDQLPAPPPPALNITIAAVNDSPEATGLSAAETYVEDTPLNLSDIVISDVDHTEASIKLSLSLPEAGLLTTATAGTVSSSYDEAAGVWSASGDISALNTLLANLEFVPAPDFNGDFSIVTSLSDGVATLPTGLKLFTASPVNDAPTGSVTISSSEPIENDILIAANTLADDDGLSEAIRYQWLRDGSAIDGATSDRYTVTLEDVGSLLSVVASYTDDEGTLESVSSDATGAVMPRNLPATLNMSKTSISISEYPTSTERVRLADIEIVDDGIGDNEVALGGADAALFEIENGVLYLKANVQLDFETATRLEVFVQIDDPEIPGTPDDAEVFEVHVEDFDETALIADQIDAAASAAQSASSASEPEPEAEPELSAESVEIDVLSVASSISDDLERGLLPGASRAFDSEFTGDPQNSHVLISGVDPTAQNHLQGLAADASQVPTQIVDLEQLLELDAPDALIDPISVLDELVTVDPMNGFSLLDNSTFQSGLDDMRRQVLNTELQNKIVVGSTVSVTTGVSIGYVLWLIRGSVLLSTVLSSVPAWRLIDPLPVISGMLNEEDEDAESLESIIEDSAAEADTSKNDTNEQPE